MLDRNDEAAERHREQVRRANRARKKAVDQLIKNHPVEFDRLYAELAVQNGVTPYGRRGVPKVAKIQAQIAELQAQLAKVTEQQEAAG